MNELSQRHSEAARQQGGSSPRCPCGLRTPFLRLSTLSESTNTMAAGRDPMLSHRPSSEQSLEAEAEDDALLTGEPTTHRQQTSRSRSWKFWRETGLFAWAFIATALLIILSV